MTSTFDSNSEKLSGTRKDRDHTSYPEPDSSKIFETRVEASSSDNQQDREIKAKNIQNNLQDTEFEKEYGILTPDHISHSTISKQEHKGTASKNISEDISSTHANKSNNTGVNNRTVIEEDKIIKSDIALQNIQTNIRPQEETDLTDSITEDKTSETEINEAGAESATENENETLEEQSKENIFSKIKNIFKHHEQEIAEYDPELHGPLVAFGGLEGYDEVERYWLIEPYSFVTVQFNQEINSYIYYVVEPEMSDFESLFLAEIKKRLRDVLLFENINESINKESILESKIRSIVKDYAIDITPVMLEKISYYIKRDFIRFGKIDPLMYDNSIEDISVNGHDVPVFLYHRKYHNIETNISFSEKELDSYIIQLAQKSGKHISLAQPMIDATVPDGSRIQMTLGSTITTRGGTFTIRKFSDIPVTPVDLIKWGTFSAESMAYLWLCIENNKSLIYAGGTASGKTSSLNSISLFIPEKSKVVTLEDTRELKLSHMNWIPAITRDSFTADERGAVDMYELLKAALRQRPEYIIVGEVRGREALTLFQAMSTGHTTFSTMHADSVASAIHRLENPPINVPRTMIQALDIICIQAQTYSKGERVRRNLKIVEIIDIDPNTKNIRTNDIFLWDSISDSFHQTGDSKALKDIVISRGWSNAQIRRELDTRKKILEYMVNNNITDFKEITSIINTYQSNPHKVLDSFNLVE
ncbi:type II secretion system protein E [Methanosalsum zhilinae DSM 4017]|uniref:Type II secretion system protein E n=1 Tax=Methanosalsum zhilinae (strain DSM 4017 / NBRC 107636 / OCM 62 / WeN5) TaxID=679901 RepID=F7XPP8_METZD|nr:type II/IV secretion system ATPase subunit [Methanosalsum zhilinae]AEH60318.1 type II secretion system protein E [Methanosalsum zhilinae DSM 4017]